MGKNGNWFRAVKKALASKSKDPKRDDHPQRSSQIDEMMMNQQAAIAIATAKAAEAAMAAAQAASELVRLANAARLPEKPNKEISAIRIQTAFRAYLGRRAISVLRGQARLKTFMQGSSVNRQTGNARKWMRTLVRVQFEVRARRARVSEENKKRQRELIENHSKELDKLQKLEQNEEDWNSSSKSKEHVEARVISKQEAAMRRERTLAYSFNHQRTWRNIGTTKATETIFMDSINPHWGWSWLDSWLAARPSETLTAPSNPGLARLRSSSLPTLVPTQIAKPPSKQRITSSPGRLSSSTKPKPTRRLTSIVSLEDEDNESLASSSADVVPHYMALTESARAKSRAGSLSPSMDDRMSVSSAKRRVSYASSSPARSIRSPSPSLGDGK